MMTLLRNSSGLQTRLRFGNFNIPQVFANARIYIYVGAGPQSKAKGSNLKGSTLTPIVIWLTDSPKFKAMASHIRHFSTLTFDIVNDLLQNILTDSGFEYVLTQVSKVRRVGIVVLAPVCSSFCWINRFTSGRSLIEPLGNEHVSSVEHGNTMVSRIILILQLIMARGAVFVLEQPRGSILPEHPRFVAFILQYNIWQVSSSCLGSQQCDKLFQYPSVKF
jgi:hypothetical protein